MPREGVILLEDCGINFIDRVPYLMPVRSDVVAGHAEQGQFSLAIFFVVGCSSHFVILYTDCAEVVNWV
jgi:hypothetical protein